MEIELLEIESLKSSVSIPESVRSETKSKFDALLKNALKKTSKRRSGVTEFSKSSERLIDDDNDETQGRDNEGYSGSTKPPKKEAELSTSSEESEAEAKVESNKSSERLIPDEEAFPVPKPRKSKKSNAHIVSAASFESDGTYDLTSPKIIHRVEAANKVCYINKREIWINFVVRKMMLQLIQNLQQVHLSVLETFWSTATLQVL